MSTEHKGQELGKLCVLAWQCHPPQTTPCCVKSVWKEVARERNALGIVQGESMSTSVQEGEGHGVERKLYIRSISKSSP